MIRLTIGFISIFPPQAEQKEFSSNQLNGTEMFFLQFMHDVLIIRSSTMLFPYFYIIEQYSIIRKFFIYTLKSRPVLDGVIVKRSGKKTRDFKKRLFVAGIFLIPSELQRCHPYGIHKILTILCAPCVKKAMFIYVH